MDEWYINFSIKLLRDSESTIQPLIHLIIPNLQVLPGEQDYIVEWIQVIISITGKGCDPEEIQQPPQLWEVVHQIPQLCIYTIYICIGPVSYGQLKEDIW